MSKRKSKPNKRKSKQTPTPKQHPVADTKPDTATEEAGASASHKETKQDQIDMTLKARLLWLWRAIKPHITANRAMVFFTIVIAVVGGVQACIYQSQLTEMRIGQRAWLKVKFQPLKMAVGGQVCASIVLTNTGKTPAKHIEGMTVVREIPIADPIDFDHPPISANTDIINPPLGAFHIFRMGALFPDDPLPLNDFCLLDKDKTGGATETWSEPMQARFDRGETYIDTHGEFTYDDAAGRQHWTRFCYINVAPGKTPNLLVSRSCAAYNSIDEN